MSDDATPTGQPEPVLIEAERLRALNHPLRLRIFTEITIHGRLRTSDIAAAVGEPANKVSYHLSALARAGAIKHAEAPAHSTDGRETWWGLASDAGFTWDMQNPELDTVIADLEAVGDAALAELRTRSYPILRQGGWHAIHSQLPVALTKAESDELFERLFTILREVFDLRRERLEGSYAGDPDPSEATYLLDINFYPFAVRTAQQPPEAPEES